MWQSALRNTDTILGVNGGPGLIDLYARLIDQLANDLDLLGTLVHVHQSYFLLDAPRVLQVRRVLKRAYVLTYGLTLQRSSLRSTCYGPSTLRSHLPYPSTLRT